MATLATGLFLAVAALVLPAIVKYLAEREDPSKPARAKKRERRVGACRVRREG